MRSRGKEKSLKIMDTKSSRDKKGRFIKGFGSPQFIDLTGKKFGRLYVIKRISWEKGKEHRQARWLCKCDCGNFAIVTGWPLRNGRTKSCGCYKREKILQQKIEPGKAIFNQLYNSYKIHSKRYKIKFSFDLTKNEFKKLTKQNCFYCNKKPSQILKSRHNNGDYIYNGIDRLDNRQGYIIGNCVSCCKVCNMMKKDLGIEEFLKYIETIYNYRIVKQSIKTNTQQ